MKVRICLLLLIVAASSPTSSQELLATVNVNLNNPTDEERRNWDIFAADVEAYLNSYNWTTNFSGERIRATFGFSITGYSGSKYTAQLFIQSSRPLAHSSNATTMARFSDDKVEFSYVRGQSLQHGLNYRSLESILDYYAYIILGLEFDSYGKLEGDEFFKNALTQALVANASGGTGWDRVFASSGSFSRYGLAEDLTNVGSTPIRQLISNYHFNVLDLQVTEPEKARANYAMIIDSLITLKRTNSALDRSVYFKTFLDAKYPELAEFGRWFKDNLDLYYRKLTYLDPTHRTFYEEIKKKYSD